MRDPTATMRVQETTLPGVKVIEPKIFGDHRGFFLETYNYERYRDAGIEQKFVQDNHSKSTKGVLRGLHYQLINPQDKLVWCIKGAVWDVAVDVRKGSKTFGQWFGVELDAESKRQILVPKGFAHGFVVLSDEAEVIYKCTDVYNPKGEGGIIWNDPAVGIEWPITDVTLSEKDAILPALADAQVFEEALGQAPARGPA